MASGDAATVGAVSGDAARVVGVLDAAGRICPEPFFGMDRERSTAVDPFRGKELFPGCEVLSGRRVCKEWEDDASGLQGLGGQSDV